MRSFVFREPVLVVSGVGFVLLAALVGHFPTYSPEELQVLFILFSLFVAVKGLEQSGLFSRFSRILENRKAIPATLVAGTFLFSMLVTNDAALIVVVPLTLTLQIDRRDILVILEALAANAGSALTPFGNPQNLYIYWFYHLTPVQFILAIAPFSLCFLFILLVIAFFLKTDKKQNASLVSVKLGKFPYVHSLLLIVVLLSILHVLPVFSSILILWYLFIRERKSLQVDYSLLLIFFFFFGFVENLKSFIRVDGLSSDHVFLLTAFFSQLVSNVPAALLFAKFTANWKALLWGANSGGFGSLLGSLANLIAYRFYVVHDTTDNPVLFAMKFLFMGYIFFFLALGLYFVLPGIQ